MPVKVVVTGMGIVSALGTGVGATLTALRTGRGGIGALRFLPTAHEELPAGEVALSNADLSQMLGVGYPVSELRTPLLGLLAAREAIVSARLDNSSLQNAAFINGTTVGGMDKTEAHFKPAFDSNSESPDALELKYNDCGYSTELIADNLGGFAMVTTPSTACSSAANAIIFAANLIKAGIVDIAVAGGAESLTKFHLNGFNSLMILDSRRCRPFETDRNGINLGEGAAYIVLESVASAKDRGVSPMAELSGYGNACDAFHQTATSENGEGAFLAMTKALEMAGTTPAQIDYINAHGTGTQNNDATELAAMRRIWGANLPPFSSTKSFTGHTTSASGAIEAVICLLAMTHGFLPPQSPDGRAINDVTLRNVIDNSFGFGGNDSSLIFSKI